MHSDDSGDVEEDNGNDNGNGNDNVNPNPNPNDNTGGENQGNSVYSVAIRAKKNEFNFWFFSRFALPLTCSRRYFRSRKLKILLVFFSLIRTSDLRS